MNREEMLRRLRAGEDPLDLSIEKWKDIVVYLQKIQSAKEFDESLEEGMRNCALCETFRDCKGCPIFEETGTSDCKNTSYYDFQAAWDKNDLVGMLSAAKRMLELLEKIKMKKLEEFLKSLEDESGKKLTNNDIAQLIEIDNFAQEHNLPELHEKVAKIIVSIEKTIPVEDVELKEGEAKKLSENIVIRKRKDNMIEIGW